MKAERDRREHRQARPQSRIWGLSALLALAAITLILAGDLSDAGAYERSPDIPWPLIAVLFYLTEVYVVHVQFRRDSESFSLSEIPVVIGLFFVEPVALIGAQLIGAGVALAVKRRQSPVKLAFNLSHLALDTTIAALIFRAIAQPGGLLATRELTAAFVATGAAIVVGVLSVISAIALAENELPHKMVLRMLGLGLIGTASNTSLALVAVSTIRTHSWASWLLVVPTVTLIFAYRAYSSQRQQHRRLQQMNDAARAVQESREIEPATLALLEHTRSMFRAEIAEIITLPTSERPALRTTLGPGDTSDVLVPITLEAREGVWARVSAEGQGVLLARPIRNERLREHFAAQGIRDAMVAPLYSEDAVVGILVVANRVGDVSTFTRQDLDLFEMLANHATVSLENARLMSQLQESLVRLTELNRMKDDFVATVSHELRTPLTSIKGSVKTIARLGGFQDETQRQLFDVIDRQSERLRDLIEDLLLASKIESQAYGPRPTLVSVPMITDRVIETFTERLADRALTIDIEPTVGRAYTDEETVYRILCNLVENAIKYSPDGSPISIDARLEDGWILLSVRDRGFGVAPDQHEAIFERFYQVDQSTTRRVGGAGLGLYICRRLAERVGAHVWLERSEPGEGSTFCLRVPSAVQAPAGIQLPV